MHFAFPGLPGPGQSRRRFRPELHFPRLAAGNCFAAVAGTDYRESCPPAAAADNRFADNRFAAVAAVEDNHFAAVEDNHFEGSPAVEGSPAAAAAVDHNSWAIAAAAVG